MFYSLKTVRRIALFALCLLPLMLSAQSVDFNHYRPLESQAPLSNKLNSSLDEKLERLKKDYAAYKKADDRGLPDYAYFKWSLHQSHYLLQSGEVLVNDPISQYLNALLKRLLPLVPELADKEVEAFTIRSTQINATSYEDFNIYVNLGLLAQAENEAQIAFILLRELVKLRDHHNATFSYNRKLNAEMDARINWQRIYYQLLVNVNILDKETRMDIDEEALEIYAQTSYPYNAVKALFDVLEYNYLPFALHEFDYAYLEDEYLRFPADYKMTDLSQNIPFDYADEEEKEDASEEPDNFFSHIKDRRARINVLIDKRSEKEQAAPFQLDEARFERLRKTARYELPLIYMEYGNTINVILTSYLLDKEYGPTDYTRSMIDHVLYLHMSRSYSGDILRFYPKQLRGEGRRIAYLLNKIEKDELSLWASRRIAKAWLASDDDIQLRSKLDDLLYYMYELGYTDINYFSDKAYEEPQNEEAETAKAAGSEEEASKYDRIRSKQKQQETFWEYAFVDLLKSEAFVKRYNKMTEIIETVEEEGEHEDVSSIFLADTEEKRDGSKKAPYQLGLKKVLLLPGSFIGLHPKMVFIDNEEYLGLYPAYGTDLRTLHYSAANQLSDLHQGMLQEAAAEAEGLEAELLRPKSGWTAERLNHLLELNRWLREQNQASATITTFYQNEVEALMKTYGTPYAMYTYSRKQTSLVYYNTLFDLRTGRYQPLVPEKYQELRKAKKISKVLSNTLEQIAADPAE